MAHSLNCPNCSAPLEITDNSHPSIHCPYCHTLLIVTDELLIKPHEVVGVTDSEHGNLSGIQIDLAQKVGFIKEMAMAGNKIIAVKAMTDLFNIEKGEAQELVEAMAHGEAVDTSQLPPTSSESIVYPALDPITVQKLVDLIHKGEKIEAIKSLMKETGIGLQDAKDVIDGMAATVSISPGGNQIESETALLPSTGHKIPKSNKWLVTGSILFIFLVVVLPILVGMTSNGGPLAGVWARVNPFAVGRVTLSFGKEGTGPGYFDGAGPIAVDNNGHIFVAEYSGGRVQVFDDQGKFLTQWIASGEESSDIYLSGMVASREGAVYTVVNSQLYVYDGLNGRLLGKLEHPDGWGFDDVTLAADGSVIAAWYKNRDDLLRFTRNGDLDLILKGAIETVTGDSEMNARVAVDGSGNIYDLAYFNEAVFVFSAQGRYISRFASVGDEKGQLTSPRFIAVDNLGRIYIADFPGVMIYANDGRYLDTLAVNGAVMGMAFDDQNNLYLVADEQVLRYKLR